MEYRVIRKVTNDVDDGFASMENRVNQALAEGWQVVGGISVTTLTNGVTYVLAQAVQRLVVPVGGVNRTTFVNNDLTNNNRMRS